MKVSIFFKYSIGHTKEKTKTHFDFIYSREECERIKRKKNFCEDIDIEKCELIKNVLNKRDQCKNVNQLSQL